MKISLNWFAILTFCSLAALATACGDDDGCDPETEPEEACECEFANNTIRDGFRVCDAELNDWSDCLCAERSVRFCNEYFTTPEGATEFAVLECTLNIIGSSDTVSYTARTGTCDQPPGNFCRPMPSDDVLSSTLSCFTVGDPAGLSIDNQPFAIDTTGLEGDIALVVNADPANLPFIQFYDFPATDLLDADIEYTTCAEYTVPDYDTVSDHFNTSS